MADDSFLIRKSATLSPQTSVPTNPTNGDIYYDTNYGTFVIYDNGFWINLASQTDVASASLLNSTEFTPTVVQNSLIRVTGSIISGLYGMSASTGGKQIIIYNQSSVTLTVYSNSSNEPTLANRFITAGNAPVTVLAGDCIIVAYDGVQNRWIIASSASTPSTIPTLWVAQEIPIVVGSTGINVNFATPQADTSYVVFAMMENLIDAFPMYQQVEVINKTINGFNVAWNAPLNTNNYIVSFIVPPRTNTYAEVSVGSGLVSATPTLVLPQSSGAYPVIAQMQDLVDALPQYQPLTVSAKTSSTATFAWNAPTSSNSYQIVYMLNGTVQVSAGSGQTSVVIPLPVDYGTTSYGIMVTMSNVVDAFPQFQPLLITAKTNNSVTVGLNNPTLSSNYVLTAYAISVTPP